MKIMQIIPDLSLAGAETMCGILSEQLACMGHDVEVVSLYSKKTPITENLEQKKIPVHFLRKKPGLDAGVIGRLAALFRREKPDVVHTHLYALKYAAAAAVLAGVKVKIHTMHNIAEKETTPKNRIISRFLFRHGMVVPVSLSDEVQKSVMQCYGIPAEKTPIIYNGIDIERFTPVNKQEKDTINYLHIGRFSPQKNHEMLLEAFEKVKQELPLAELTLVGEGSGEKEIREMTARKHLQECVHFAGAQADVRQFLQNADVFVLPSKYEGMPMTIIEAMASGLPVAATRVGGVASMVESGKEGILTEVESDAFAQAMLKLGKSREMRMAYGKAGREKAEQYFSAKSMAEKYVELYHKKEK